jgi:tripartite-type tricarboxylate transporter receptor subunit TctC
MPAIRGFALAMFIGLAAVCAASAQTSSFRTRTITIVVPFAAGGSTDVMARLLAEKVGAELGQSVIVANKAGAGGIIGAVAVRQSAPDGNNIVVFATTHVINPSVQEVPYDWEKDFTPIFGILAAPQAFVVEANSSIHSMADLADAAAKNPSGLTYASGGHNSLSQLTSVLFAQNAKANAVHVPYSGLAPALQAIIAKDVDFGVINLLETIPFANAGKARILAVTTEERVADLPNVPTVMEAGFPGLISVSWNAYLVPAGTRRDVVEKLNAAFNKAALNPTVVDKAKRLAVLIDIKSLKDIHGFMYSEWARWKKVINENGLNMKN